MELTKLANAILLSIRLKANYAGEHEIDMYA